MSDGIFWLDEVNCKGNEGRLDNCTHNNIGEHDCTLAEAVTVVCSSKLCTFCMYIGILNKQTMDEKFTHSCHMVGLNNKENENH